MDYQVDIQLHKAAFEEEEEEEEGAPSLSDFPIAATCECLCRSPSSSEPTDIFEFSSDDLSREMSSAEDIIFHGKLVPFKQHPQTHRTATTSIVGGTRRESFHHRRSESMSELKSTCKDEASTSKARIMRSSRSLDYRKLQRVPSIATSEINRNSSVRSCHQKMGSRPRWYLFMIGLAKFPVEMELKDIKSRQVRQTPASMFPLPPPPYEGFPVKGSNQQHHQRKRSWDLLRVLSCKGPSSVAVVSSTGFGLMPQACHASSCS